MTRKEFTGIKKEFNHIYRVEEGTSIIWYVKALKGVVAFKRKKDAVAWTEQIAINKAIKK